jgi:uncharacterized membrane protein YbaN (DUF454 family)
MARSSALLRPILFLVGIASLVLGVVGIFLPVLPTTPFLLLAAWCFLRSSERLHRWLVGHPRLGSYLEGFLYAGGVPVRANRPALITLWPTMMLSSALVYWRVDSVLRLWIPVMLLATAMLVSVYIVTRPTLPVEPRPE